MSHLPEQHGEHNPLDHEDPLPGPLWIIGILGSVLMGVVVLGVTALFFNADSREVDDKLTNADYPFFTSLKAEQLSRLDGPPRKIEVVENDRVVENVVIPIDVAMQKFVERAAKEQASPTTPDAAAATSLQPGTSP